MELIKAGETDFNKAISQAEEEFSANFQSVIASSSNESFSDLSIYVDANSDDNAYLLTLSSMLYQHAIDVATSNQSSAEAELTSIINELESDFGTDGKVDDTNKLTAIKYTQKRIDPTKVTQHLIDWLGENNQFTVPNINAYLDTDLDGITNNQDSDDDNDGIADEDDTSQFVADFVIENKSISLPEDETVSVEIATNNPLGNDEPIIFNLMSDVNSGSLEINYPNISYTPVENYNGKDEFTFKLIQGNVESKLVTFSIDVTAVNDAPTIDGTPLTKIIADQEYIFIPSAMDIDGDNLTFSVENLPEWLSFDLQTGEIKGTAGNENASTFSEIVISVTDSTDSSSLKPFSLTVNYTALTAPKDLKYVSNSTESTLKPVELSWSMVQYANSYEVQLSDDETFSNIVHESTIETESLKLNLAADKYYWRIRTLNPQGVPGVWSETKNIEVDVFDKVFGGLKDEKSRKVINTSDRGYLILGETNSPDIYEDVGSESAYWIFKIDSKGDKQWEFFLDNKPGNYSLYNIKELHDGSFSVVGRDPELMLPMLIRLSNEGELLNKIIYQLSNYTGIFSDVAQVGEKTYASSSLSCSSNQCDGSIKSIHEVDFQSGVISAPLNWGFSEDYRIESSLFLDSSQAGNLIVSGTAAPVDANEHDYWRNGAFVTVLDKSLEPKMHWQNIDNDKIYSLSTVKELTNGNFVIVGSGLFSHISIVDREGELISQSNYYAHEYYQTLVSESNDEMFTIIFKDTDDDKFKIRTYRSSLEVFDERVIMNIDFSKGYLKGFFEHLDGTYTIIRNMDSNSESMRDISIIKTKIK